MTRWLRHMLREALRRWLAHLGSPADVRLEEAWREVHRLKGELRVTLSRLSSVQDERDALRRMLERR